MKLVQTRPMIALLLTAVTTVLASFAEQPNVIILFADDLGYGELSCQGNPEIPTPHIDSIAAGGVRFTSGYVAGPNCSPSRDGLLTARIATRFGYEFNPTGARNEEPGFGLPPEEITIAETLHDAGYTTGLIGKWHQGGSAMYHPFRHGFDELFGFTHEGHYFVPPPYKGVTTMLRRKTLPGGGKGRRIGKKGLIYGTDMSKRFQPGNALWELYGLSNDISEETYLAKDNPERVTELLTIWKKMNDEMSDLLF